MPRYTIRIELHNANSADYKELARQLATQNIVDIVTGEDGYKYKLPPAEYNYDGPATLAQLRDIARATAKSVGRACAVLVTESNGRLWSGLELVP